MNKSTAKLIVVIVITLSVINVSLIALIWSRTNGSAVGKPNDIHQINSFVIEELDFNEEDAKAFKTLAEIHHQNQKENQKKYRLLKRSINSQLLSDDSIDIDSLSMELAELSVLKEKEFYRFMQEVMKICDDDQKAKLTDVFLKATLGSEADGR